MRKKILVAPLNWGIGHATRDIPVIRELLRQGAEVVIAADGRSGEVLRKEFPHLRFIQLKGYDIHYHHRKKLSSSIISQLPQIFRSIYYEHRWLRKLLKKELFDAVISDNRFGLYSNKTQCIFITHQLNIQMPPGLKWIEATVNRINRGFISKYPVCWIPDYAGEPNLSGKLSHEGMLPSNIKYVGPLSRLEKKQGKEVAVWDLLLLLSGPEPQRTVLEEILVEQAKTRHRKTLMVRGVPEGTSEIHQVHDHFFVVDYLPTDLLQETLLISNKIVCRPGYSTVMDLAAMEMNAVLIPTPGQTEQEYIASHLKEMKICYSEKQNDFLLSRALSQAVTYAGFKNNGVTSLLPKQVEEVIGDDEQMRRNADQQIGK